MATPKTEQKIARSELLADVTDLNTRLTQVKQEMETCMDQGVLSDLFDEESKLQSERQAKLRLCRALETAVEEEYMTADEGEGTIYPSLDTPHDFRRGTKCSPKVTVQFKERLELRKLEQEHRLEKHFKEIEETFIEAGVGARFQREFIPSDDFRRIALRKLVDSLPPKMAETAQLFLDENHCEWIDLKQHLINIYMSKGRLNSVLEKKISELQFPGHALSAVFIAEGRSIFNLFKVIESRGPGEDLKGQRDILERIISKCPQSYRKAIINALRGEKIDLEYGGVEQIDVWDVIAEHAKEAQAFERLEPPKSAAVKKVAPIVDLDTVAALYDENNQQIRLVEVRPKHPFLYGIFGTKRVVNSLSPDVFSADRMLRGEAKSGGYVVMCFTEDPGLETVSVRAKEFNCSARYFEDLKAPEVPRREGPTGTPNFH